MSSVPPAPATKAKQSSSLPRLLESRSRPTSKLTKNSSLRSRKEDLFANDTTLSSTSSKYLSHVPCKFFKQGSCQAGEKCPFSHATDPASAAGRVMCKFFKRGNCKFGSKCALAHSSPNGQRVNNRLNQSNPPNGVWLDAKGCRPTLSSPRPGDRENCESIPAYSGPREQNMLDNMAVDHVILHHYLGRTGEDLNPPNSADPFSYAALHHLPRLTLLAGHTPYVPHFSSNYYTSVFSPVSPTAPPDLRPSYLQELLLSGNYGYYNSSVETDNDSLCQYEDLGIDVFEEDCVPESLVDVILTPQENVRRKSRSQLGKLLSRPQVHQSPRMVLQEIETSSFLLYDVSAHSANIFVVD